MTHREAALMAQETHPTIWIDGDGVPKAVKEIVFKASGSNNFYLVRPLQ